MRIALTYSRDGASRPLALLAHVIKEIREGTFEPDNTRSGRLKPGAGPLDRADLFADVSEQPQEQEPLERDSPREHVSASSDLQSWQKVSVEDHADVSWRKVSGSQDGPDVEQPDEGHVTTDSSDSSNEGGDVWAPVVGHYTVELPDDKTLWLNHNSKMFHLSYSHCVNILLCGRRISASFRKHEGQIRYDSAKCRQCFRLKDD
eukprot:s871_g5.t1